MSQVFTISKYVKIYKFTFFKSEFEHKSELLFF